jgi:hypothetical protein
VKLNDRQKISLLNRKMNTDFALPPCCYFISSFLNPSLLWSKNLALLVLWGLRNPKFIFYLEIKKTFLFSNINGNMFNEPF